MHGVRLRDLRCHERARAALAGTDAKVLVIRQAVLSAVMA
jgi:hypothetical protein